MPVTRTYKTPVDYLVMSLSPPLIMLLVGSLCFFLVRIFYIGEALGSVRWVLFWYVLAVVLIARIGIEQSEGRAVAYGVLLAVVTWFYLLTVHPAYLVGAILLAVVWWSAHRLTCDCTLIDDDDDASGQGLLQLAWGRWRKKADNKIPGTVPAETASRSRPAVLKSGRTAAKASRVLHPPGVWLVYFSAAALPLFGIGQTLLPADDIAARHGVLAYLLTYLAAALGLMLTTSFLGLRRYLRQRFLPMPGRIAFGWLQFGASLAAIVLVLAFLVPRPGVGTAWKTLGYQIDHQLRRASEYAMRFNAPGKGAGRPGEHGQSQNNPPGSDSNPKLSSPSSSSSSPPSSPPPSPTPSPSSPPLSSAAATLYHWLKVLLLVVGLALVGWWIYRQREMLRQIFQSLWAAVTGFFQGLFGSRSTDGQAGQSSVPARPMRFSLYKNPFVTGNDRRWPPQQLIVYSFEAVKSWAAEQGMDAGSRQTPREFCLQLGEKYGEISPELKQLARLYGHAAYGTSVPANFNPEVIRSLWAYISPR